MRVGQYKEFIKLALSNKRRVLVKGPPGVGKTFIKEQGTEELGMDYIGLCSALEDPSTIRGYPFRDGDTARHLLFDGIARAFAATKPTVLDFDDLGMASESTTRAIIRLFQLGEIDGARLPDYVVLSASTNDVGHGAGVYGLIEPLKTRFHSIISVEANVDDLVLYGLNAGWDIGVLAYLRNDPQAINDWKPTKSIDIDGACPRGWEYVSEWCKLGVFDPEVIAGAVGKGRAAAFLAFRALMNELPDIAAVQLDPEGSPIPENPSARFLVAMAVASAMNGKNFGQFLKYLLRMPQNFRAYSVRDAVQAENVMRREKRLKPDHAAIAMSRDFTTWANTADGREIMLAGS